MQQSRTTRRIARVAIITLLLALIRSQTEYFRLKMLSDKNYVDPGTFEPFLTGAIIASVGLLAAVLFYFYSRMTAVIITVAATIAILILYKLVYM